MKERKERPHALYATIDNYNRAGTDTSPAKNGERNNIHFSDPLAARASGFLFYGMGILISY